MALIAATSILFLTCCAGALFIGFRNYSDKQQRTAEGAITEYFDALRFKNKKKLEKTLCDPLKSDASELVDQFYTQLEEAEFTLETLSWAPLQTHKEGKSKQLVKARAALVVLRGGKRFNLNIDYSIETTRSLFTWHVCSVKESG